MKANYRKRNPPVLWRMECISLVTIKMIAQKCGYSTATVSKALNGAPDISAETTELIRKTAAQMGYTPNAAARMLKTSRSYMFGVMFEDATDSGLTHEFFAQILDSFKKRSEELGYDILFINDTLAGRVIGYAEHARYRNCDGVLIANMDRNDPSVLDLASCGIPAVTIDYVIDQCGTILSDNVQGMRDIVYYLHEMGHRRIAWIHGQNSPVCKIRLASFYRSCAELGIEVPAGYVIPGFFRDAEFSAKATRQLLQMPEPPTCILYPDDVSFIGGFNEIERMGLRIPDDISVVGYDGIQMGQLLRPRLTTMKQDAVTMGRRAAEELVRSVEEGKLYIPQQITVPGMLLKGGTVKDLNAK